MQILPTTAQSTARRAGAPFDYQRLIFDPAYNLNSAPPTSAAPDDEGGSRLPAAYNAGRAGSHSGFNSTVIPHRRVDLVDWVERIPFDETRHYVERVSENLAIYRARLAVAAGPLGEKTARE